MRPQEWVEVQRRQGLAATVAGVMRMFRTVPGLLSAAALVAGLAACSSRISLLGDQDLEAAGHDDVAGDVPSHPDDAADADSGPDDGAPDDGDHDPGADIHAGGDADGGPDADAFDVPPDGPVAHLVPDERETFFDFGASNAVAMHRHEFPAAWSGSAYAVLLEDRGDDGETSGPIALFRFERGTGGLHWLWIDEAADATEYNSICWAGEAFVAVLPTLDVGLRVLAADGFGTLLRPPEVLGPDSTYVPAGHGEPPVLLCPGSGAFVLDPGRGAGGVDRLYAIAPDGAVTGDFVDADIPTFARNRDLAVVPCAVGGDDAACATDAGLAFLRGDGSLRADDPLSGAAVCSGAYGCDAAASGSDVFLVGTSDTTTYDCDLLLARWSVDGPLTLPPIAVAPLEFCGREYTVYLRAASSGSTVFAVAFGTLLERFGSASALLVGREGNPMDAIVRVATCVGPEGSDPGCSRHVCVGGGAVVWEGDAYGILWTTASGVAYRRFAVAW